VQAESPVEFNEPERESAHLMPFTVTVQPSGRSFQVDRDEPILTAAIRQGVGLPYGCKDGA
jgi:ferredoxin